VAQTKSQGPRSTVAVLGPSGLRGSEKVDGLRVLAVHVHSHVGATARPPFIQRCDWDDASGNRLLVHDHGAEHAALLQLGPAQIGRLGPLEDVEATELAVEHERPGQCPLRAVGVAVLQQLDAVSRQECFLDEEAQRRVIRQVFEEQATRQDLTVLVVAHAAEQNLVEVCVDGQHFTGSAPGDLCDVLHLLACGKPVIEPHEGEVAARTEGVALHIARERLLERRCVLTQRELMMVVHFFRPFVLKTSHGPLGASYTPARGLYKPGSVYRHAVYSRHEY
jgi:hypothetical protein